MSRPPLTEDAIERIRRERHSPRATQCDYLHLRSVRDALGAAFRELPGATGPVLDLYCGTQPYRELVPWRPVCGVDRDRYFGRTDVVSTVPLPFRDGAFSVALCTQALHLVDDPPATVRELHRVLVPGGHAVVTVPHIFRREIPAERKYGASDLHALFAGWADVDVRAFGGPGTALTYYPAGIALSAARHWRWLRALLPPAALAINAVGTVLDRTLRAVAGRWPASFIVVAQRGDS